MQLGTAQATSRPSPLRFCDTTVLRSSAATHIIIADDGGENASDNPDVARALSYAGMHLCVAQVDLMCSNSMLERFWMSMKNNFLFMQRIDSITALRRFVDFFVEQHNDIMPHSAFDGQTPAQIFRDEAGDLPAILATKRAEAGTSRRGQPPMTSGACPTSTPLEPPAP